MIIITGTVILQILKLLFYNKTQNANSNLSFLFVEYTAYPYKNTVGRESFAPPWRRPPVASEFSATMLQNRRQAHKFVKNFEKDLLNELMATQLFYQDIIYKFSSLKGRRNDFIFKK